MAHSLFSTISQERFLKDYWQKKPYLFKQAYQFDEAPLTGDDLAYLACDDAIESRFVFTDASESEWRVEHGPFSEERFASLPEKHWTLMVQSVDQWVPELYELLKGYDFLPAWRVDDILATYATEGGGVGPHFDYYDVFLIQASGQRRWKIGQYCDSQSPLRDNTDVKLLKHFGQVQDYVLSPGDVLYIPPHIAHWGTALSDDCMTLSVGFRAPSESDLVSSLLREIDTRASEDQRYKDTFEPIASEPSHEITAAAKRQARALVQNYLQRLSQDESFLQGVEAQFAKHVSSPRNLNIIEPEEGIDPQTAILKAVANQSSLFCELDAACRAAYSLSDSHATLYFNGEPHQVDEAFAKGLCEGHIEASSLQDEAQQSLLLDWAIRGYIYIQEM